MSNQRGSRSLSFVVLVALLGSLLVGGVTSEAQPSGGAMAGMTSIELQVGGVGGVPDDAELVALHVAVASPAGPGFVTVWPCANSLPNASSVNYQPGQVVQSMVLAKLDETGAVCVYVLETADLIVDVAGYVPSGSDLTALATPTRVLDTRLSGPLGDGQELRVPVRGRSGVPTNADGVGFTLTALNGVAPGFATVYPCDTPRPDSSNVNWLPGQFVPNFVISKLGVGGDVCIWALSQTDLLVDVVAWMPTDAAGLELLDQPIRSFDTRDGTGTLARPFGTGESRSIPVGAPEGAVAVLGNITAAEQGAPGLATVYPCGVPVPQTASLNWVAPPVAMNASFAPLGDDGQPCVFSLHPTHLIYDVMGYVTSPDFYTPMTPFRLYDSREDWESDCGWVPLVLFPAFGIGNSEILLYEGDGNWSNDRRISLGERLESQVQASPGCDWLLVRAWSDDDILVVDPVTGQVVERLVDLSFVEVTWTSDGKLVALFEVSVPPFNDSSGSPQAVQYEMIDLLTSEELGRTATFVRPSTSDADTVYRVELAESGSMVAVLHGKQDMFGTGGPISLRVDLLPLDGRAGRGFEVMALDDVAGFDIAPDSGAVVVGGATHQVLGSGGSFIPTATQVAYSLVGDEIARFVEVGGARLNPSFSGRGEIFSCSGDVALSQPLFGEATVLQRFSVGGDHSRFINACVNRGL